MDKRCPICRKLIRKDQELAVLSYPIGCLSDSGNYSISDFLRNERIIHFECLSFDKQINVSIANEELHRKAKDIMTALKDMGEKLSLEDTVSFILPNKTLNTTQLIQLYFKNRNKT